MRRPKVDKFGYGFRVPALLVSPYARRGHVDHTTLDFTAGMRFIEDNWGLEPVGDRDAAARTFTTAFDFSSPPRAPSLLFENLGGVGGSVARRPASRLLYGFYGAAFVVAALVLAGAFAASRRHAHLGVRPDREGAG